MHSLHTHGTIPYPLEKTLLRGVFRNRALKSVASSSGGIERSSEERESR